MLLMCSTGRPGWPRESLLICDGMDSGIDALPDQATGRVTVVITCSFLARGGSAGCLWYGSVPYEPSRGSQREALHWRSPIFTGSS